MRREKELSSDTIQKIMKHFQDSMRDHINQGTLDHRKLEKYMGDAINQLTAEVRNKAAELLNETKEEKKTAPARTVEEKPE